jgi:hypothetical protein
LKAIVKGTHFLEMIEKPKGEKEMPGSVRASLARFYFHPTEHEQRKK